MATHVAESAVINARIGAVWELLRPLTFSYLTAVKEAKATTDAGAVGRTHTVTYVDGTVQHLRLTGLSDNNHVISWDVVDSVPAITVMSVSHAVRCMRVTDTDATFVEWETNFSRDVTLSVTEDAKYKQREHFAALSKALANAATATAAGVKSAPAGSAAADSKDQKAAPAASAAAAVSVFQWETPKREMLETAAQVNALAAPLAANPNGFQKIRLSGHSFSPAAATAMAEVLRKTTALTTLDLSDIIAVRSTPDVVEVLTTLSAALTGNTKVTELNVSDNALGFAGVKACEALLARKGADIARLQVLRFNNDGLEGDAAEFITRSVLAAGKPTALRHFEIHNNCLSDAGATGLAPLFAASPNLERIRFTTTRLSSEGGDALVQSLVDCGSHTFLSIELSDNSLGEEAGRVFATKVIPNQPKLQVLNIADTGFGKKVITQVIEALHKTAPDLTALDLSNSEIDAKLAQKVAALIRAKPKLTRIGLEGNDFGNNGALAIAAAIADHKDLAELNLNGNGLTTAAVAPLFNALKSKAGLKRLSLNANKFSTKGVDSIRAAVKAFGLPEKTLDSLSENDDEDADEKEDKDLVDQLAKLSIKN